VTVSRRELNRALLARQGLLERFPPDLPAALRRIGGLQAQYAPAMYIGLWSRVAGLERDAVTRALEDRSAIQATLLRSTIHLVAADDFWPWAVAVRSARRASFLRGRPDAPPAPAMARAARTLRRRLAGGPLLRRDIEALLGKEAARGVGLWLDLVRVPPLGTWERRRADLYGLAEDWLPPVEVSKADAVARVVGSYLSGFGPAPPDDIANWAGMKITDVKRALARMELRRFRGPDGEELLDLPNAPLPDRTRPRRRASCPSGTPRCSCTRAADRSCPRSCARACSTSASPTASRRSSSTARWPAPGASRAAGSSSSRSCGSTRPTAGRWMRRPSGWRCTRGDAGGRQRDAFGDAWPARCE
jgi:hypothetical protein